ncbi:TetR/AcrR family transcriptional regulator [Caproiciproducens faecalis]|uniref:TetR/AcrR family transcriptional regulator n=1 Tax=Caproiciproducens faecalis TaxID=2820301 RepID=A0ABS7DNH5_9FIRM|nr:TetR-like C-terminal domain-containing protein [Caproiciproducens faecalis]MBW7572086.1 TetR/AcrR family transcriptional regulator [Caproiciproducens faecalis]
MKSGEQDRRVKYTKMVLRESLLELMKDKPITKITPTELCRLADINRNTFYAHYSSPMDLLSTIENELYEEVIQAFECSFHTDTMEILLTEICQVIRNHSAICKILFSEYGDKDFLKRVIYLAHDKTVVEWKTLMHDSSAEMVERLFTFTVNGSMAIIQDWILKGAKESPSEIAHFINSVTHYGLRAFTGSNMKTKKQNS